MEREILFILTVVLVIWTILIYLLGRHRGTTDAPVLEVLITDENRKLLTRHSTRFGCTKEQFLSDALNNHSYIAEQLIADPEFKLALVKEGREGLWRAEIILKPQGIEEYRKKYEMKSKVS